ncbi:hypothetical protein V3M52_00980 [Trueperella pyogenes]|uniref:hypothetical protein n=1 Tax=Trueperella pyogenes TaxID=1661 RepID=UPI00345D45B7
MEANEDFYKGKFDSSRSDGARWFDQKVTFGNLAEVASAVKSTVDLRKINEFTRIDIQNSASLNNTIRKDYGKPSLLDKGAANEYDKFIAQNLNVLAYAGVLSSTLKSNKSRTYKIKNREILDKLAGDEKEARIFLIAYIRWVLESFNWWSHVKKYIESDHTKDDLSLLKDAFTDLLIDTMALGSKGSKRPEVEAGRIFAKVLNPIAYAEMVPGIEHGRVMKNPPSTFELTYNRPNWRDTASKKPKHTTRKEYEASLERDASASRTGNVTSAEMKRVRDYHQGVSEVPDSTGVKATHVHHIFPKHQFSSLADVRENLIALTPGQHLGNAHPNGNTQKIDPIYQRTCLNQKLQSIKRSIEEDDGMYSYENFATVLQTGWELEALEPTFSALRQAIVDHLA